MLVIRNSLRDLWTKWIGCVKAKDSNKLWYYIRNFNVKHLLHFVLYRFYFGCFLHDTWWLIYDYCCDRFFYKFLVKGQVWWGETFDWCVDWKLKRVSYFIKLCLFTCECAVCLFYFDFVFFYEGLDRMRPF